MKYGTSLQLGKWRKTAQVKTGILRSVGLILLGKGKGFPNKREELTQLRFIRKLGELMVSRKTLAAVVGMAPLSSVQLPQKREP